MSEIIEYRGFEIKISQDEHPSNPRTDWDNGSTMVCFHSRYDLGDKKHNFNMRDYSSWEELKKAIIKEKKPIAILPLYLFDHSGITMSTTGFSCNWDSGQVGFIYVDEKGCEEMGWTKEWAKVLAKGDNEKYKGKSRKKILTDFLISDVETYDQYLTGEVYGFEIDGCDDGNCSGFFGDDHEESGLLDQARNVIDCEINFKMKERIGKLKKYIKHRVPFTSRKLPSLI